MRITSWRISAYNALAERYEKASALRNNLEADVARRKAKAQQMTAFIELLNSAPDALEEGDSKIWLLLEKGTVHRDGYITFEFRNGEEIGVEAD